LFGYGADGTIEQFGDSSYGVAVKVVEHNNALLLDGEFDDVV